MPPPSNSTSQSATKGTGPAPEAIEPEDIADEDAEFARQFAAEMEAFMQGLTNGGALSQVTGESSGSNSAGALPDHDEMQKAWKKLLVEDLEADPASSLEAISSLPGSSSRKPPASDSTAAEDTFQNAVKQAMEKLKESDDTIKVQTSLLWWHFSHLLVIGRRSTWSGILACDPGTGRRWRWRRWRRRYARNPRNTDVPAHVQRNPLRASE